MSGFVGGTYNRFGGFYAVRQGDAHSWVEAYIDGGDRRGWVTFDPTPAAGAQPLADQGGAWSLVRDVIEAMSQGWDRYVVGYDLPTQMTLFQRLQRTMQQARRQMLRGNEKRSERPNLPRRWYYIGIGVAAASGAVAYLLMKRRKRSLRSDGPRTNKDRQHRVATQLWLQLEEALQVRGAPRPHNTPPLRFTEQLRSERSDSLGEEAFLLASRYTQARFGNLPFTADEQVEFTKRVATLRRGEPHGASALKPI
ncbi:MAG: hypothetical protein NVS3B20_08390 [Polyangiales bacterium]